MNERCLEVLIVDDDPGDVELMREAVSAWRSKPRLAAFASGEELLRYLEGAGKDDRCRLVLLDLNMPGLGGRETLRRIRRTPSLRPLVVIIVTTSESRDDVRNCYEAGANGYVVKPLDLDQLITAARRIEDFWVDTAALPRIS
jgi:CheY-like chemotaxis protein